MTKFVYAFGGGTAEGRAGMKDLLGGKGANLAEMSNLGLPVPPGFTISTEVCTYYYEHGQSFPEELKEAVGNAIARVGEMAGGALGNVERPLLVSVRSGARVSMPGMMDTVLNLGLNPESAETLARITGNPRFAYDTFRRFVHMYANVVLGLPHERFEEILELEKETRGIEYDTDLDASDLRRIADKYRDEVQKATGAPFPDDANAQLWGAIGAVFRSWQSPRAKTYRKLHDIPESWGTAVNVQAMVFGNRGETSATGVAFTRDPSTGERLLYGEFLINAQGEDVVAGIRTPQPISKVVRERMAGRKPSMEEAMPDSFAELKRIAETLEAHYRDMQDVEFTVQEGRLFMLQTRSGKRAAEAALKIAVDMVGEGLVDRRTALLRIDPSALDQLLHPTLDKSVSAVCIATGLAASPGAATGEIVFTAEEAAKLAADGRDVILVRLETSPEDIHGMHVAKGVLTARGGMTSHAAVVARGMGRPCVSGAGALKIDSARGVMTVGSRSYRQGDVITIDGASGQVFQGRVPMRHPEMTREFATLMGWADEFRRIGVRANADTPADATTARRFGAEGIGLCRTEHMFFEADRIVAVRCMILADSRQEREAALRALLPMQRSDFVGIFRVMQGLPVTVRLLDPPLHEFLPHTEDEIAEIAGATGKDMAKLRQRALALRETNPMLGHRGCRLGITFPEIYEMQIRAIFEAALEVREPDVRPATLEIMVPLVGFRSELDFLAKRIAHVADDVRKERGTVPDYTIGTMIELPRAALRAGEIAEIARFFSFGTNDLTQTTLGLSRDDAGTFLGDYLEKRLIDCDPFVSLDMEGVGELITIAKERGRKTRPDLKLGICGEHGGDPLSIGFCHANGLDYVSCSPFRVPVARLAAAQAAIRDK